MAKLKRYCGNHIMEIDNGKYREYCGNYLYELDGYKLKRYGGIYLYEFDGRSSRSTAADFCWSLTEGILNGTAVVFSMKWTETK